MAKVLKAYRIANPGRVKRKASPAQLAARAKFKAMVQAKRHNPRKRLSKGAKVRKSSQGNSRTRKATKAKDWVKSAYYNKDSVIRARKAVARENPGEIITIGLNPGKVRKVRKVKTIMAKRRKSVRRRATAKRVNPVRRRRRISAHRRRTNPVRYVARKRRATKRRNPFFARRRRVIRRRRHNPSFGGIKTTGVMIAGVIGGAIITKKVVDIVAGMFPQAASGFMKYIVTGAVASILGFGVGKFAKSPQLGSGIALGGYTLMGLQIANDLIPGFSGFNPFGVNGMGMITDSSFYTPQVPTGSGMNRFVTPAAVQMAMPVMKGMKGIGNVMTHPGRTRLTRVA